MGLFDMSKTKPPKNDISDSAKHHFELSRQEAAKARKRAEQLLPELINALQTSAERGGGANISLYEIKHKLDKMVSMQFYLKNTPVLRLRTDEIDKMLRFYAVSAADAVEKDYPTEFKYAIDALVWGILVARSDIHEAEYEQMTEIIKKRLESLALYKFSILSAALVDEKRFLLTELRRREEELNKSIEEYGKFLDEPKNRFVLEYVQKRLAYIPGYTCKSPIEEKVLDFLRKKNAAAEEKSAVANKISYLSQVLISIPFNNP